MNFLRFWFAFFSFAFTPLYINRGGSSKTDASQSMVDQKVGISEGGVGGSASGGSTLTINALDGGAIHESFGLAHGALDSVTSLATGALSGAFHTSDLAMSGALSTIKDTRAAFDTATDKISGAYNDAKIGDRQTMQTAVIVIGGALAAVVALAAIKKG